VRDYVLTLLVAAAVTYLLTPLVRRLAIRAGAMFEPRERDVHTVPVPRMGGLAMYAGLAAGLLVAEQIPQLRAQFGSTGMVSGLLLAGGLLVVIGMIDDKWGMSALSKAAGQVAAGAILVATGTQLSWLPMPGGSQFAPTPDQSALLTILVVVATINAVNFIDGLDGLAAGIVAISAASFLLYYYKMAQVAGVSELAAPALASAILTGVCLGFLPHNFHPAKIFMGDTGAMLLGLVLAYAPISSITSIDPALASPRINRYPVVLPLLLPAAILVIPYLDLLLAVIRRMRAGQSPFAADSKHLHHRLMSIGHSQRATVLVMYLWAAVFSGAILWFSLERVPRPGAANHHGQPVLVFVVITAAAILALVLMSLPWLRKRDQAAKPQAAAAPAGPPSAAPALAPAAPVPNGTGQNGTASSSTASSSTAPNGAAAPLPARPPAGPPARSVVGSGPPADPWLGPRSGQFSWTGGPPDSGNGMSRTGSAAGPPPPAAAQAPETTPIPAADLAGRTGEQRAPERS
jgi:UDP-GlcNAc:undecaprenyl-phosphate/decaprenyl-phosphate GlcNAc-1-phosphate transferase